MHHRSGGGDRRSNKLDNTTQTSRIQAVHCLLQDSVKLAKAIAPSHRQKDRISSPDLIDSLKTMSRVVLPCCTSPLLRVKFQVLCI